MGSKSSTQTTTRTLDPNAAAALGKAYSNSENMYNFGMSAIPSILAQNNIDSSYLESAAGYLDQLKGNSALQNIASGAGLNIYNDDVVRQGADAITSRAQKAGGSLANSVMGQAIQAGHSPSSSGYLSAQRNANQQMTDSITQQLTQYYLGQQNAAKQDFWSALGYQGNLANSYGNVGSQLANIDQQRYQNILNGYQLGGGIAGTGLSGMTSNAGTWAGNTGTQSTTSKSSGGGWGNFFGGIIGAGIGNLMGGGSFFKPQG